MGEIDTYTCFSRVVTWVAGGGMLDMASIVATYLLQVWWCGCNGAVGVSSILCW